MENVLATTWLRKQMTKTFCGHIVRKRGEEKSAE
jgi:hypothetical protein